MLAVVASLLFAFQAEEPPKVTYEDSGDFRLLALDLERRFKGGRVRFAKGIESKDVAVSVKDAGFYEVLDALCKAHKEAHYIPDATLDHVDGVTLFPGTWVDHPTAYSGHFKVILASMMRAVVNSTDEKLARVDVPFLLFAPPWIEVGWDTGTENEWKLTEAVDAGGRNLMGRNKGEAWSEGRITYDHKLDRAGNLIAHTFRLADFDLSKGLKLLAGEATLKVAGYRAIRLAAEEGAAAEIPQGTLTVASIAKDEDEACWSIQVHFKPKEGRRSLVTDRILASQVRYDGGKGAWGWLQLRDEGFTVETQVLARAPKWIEVKLLLESRTIQIPFRFTDVVFKGE